MILLAPLLFLVGASAQSEAAPADWAWDSDTPVCRLTQKAATGDSVELTRTPGNEETEVTISVPSHAKVMEGRFRDGTIALNSSGEAVNVTTFINEANTLQVYAVVENPAFLSAVSNASELAISHPRIGSYRVPLRSAAEAVAALTTCEDWKMRQWGIDSSAWRALKSRPVPLKPVRERFGNLDYPAAAAAQGVEADAVIRLDVGSEGRVTGCRSLNVGLYAGFEEAACKVLQGARFRPATDSAGNAVSAPYVYDVRFRLEG